MLNIAFDSLLRILALGSHLGRHLENDPFPMVRIKGTFSMLKSMENSKTLVKDSIEKPFVSIFLGLGGISSQIDLPTVIGQFRNIDYEAIIRVKATVDKLLTHNYLMRNSTVNHLTHLIPRWCKSQ